MKYHIVRVSADINAIVDMQQEQVVRAAYGQCLRVIRGLALQIGNCEFDGGLFLATQEATLRFLAGSPSYHPQIYIEIFSLSDAEDQLVPPSEFQDLGSMERYRISKLREG